MAPPVGAISGKVFLKNLGISAKVLQAGAKKAQKNRTPAIQQASGRSNLLFSSIPTPQQAIVLVN